MISRFIRKLENLAPLDDEDKSLLDEITANVHQVDAKTDLIVRGKCLPMFT